MTKTTVHYCGCRAVPPSGAGPNMADLSENPSSTAYIEWRRALINEGNVNSIHSQPARTVSMPLRLHTGSPRFPFQILAGSSNPTRLTAGLATSRAANRSFPCPSSTRRATLSLLLCQTPQRLRLWDFCRFSSMALTPYGNLDVVVLNVAGCSNGGGQTLQLRAPAILRPCRCA